MDGITFLLTLNILSFGQINSKNLKKKDLKKETAFSKKKSRTEIYQQPHVASARSGAV